MNWLDVVLAVLVAGSVIAGLAKGFSRTVVGIVAVVVGLVVAIWTYGVAGSFLLDWVSHPAIAHFIGFLLVFIATVAVGELVGRILAKLLKWAGLGWLDRIMGAGAGLVRGVLLAMGFVLLLCAFTRQPPPSSVVGSRIAPYVIDASGALAAIAPRELKDGFDTSYAKAKELWAKMVEKAPRHITPEKF